MNEELQVEPGASHDYGPCECCGNYSRCVSGFLHTSQGTLCLFFVHWTLNRVADHGANFDLILRNWGDHAKFQDHDMVSLAYRLLDSGPTFMVIDGKDRPSEIRKFAGRVLRRDEVINQPIAEPVFPAVDVILAQDDRVSELLGPYRIIEPGDPSDGDTQCGVPA